MRNNLGSHGLREMTAPPAPYTGMLVGDAEPTCVIESGYTGLSAALHLAKRCAGRCARSIQNRVLAVRGAGWLTQACGASPLS